MVVNQLIKSQLINKKQMNLQNLNNYDFDGTFEFGNQMFVSCNIQKNGLIYFGDTITDEIDNADPFSNYDRNFVAPFSGNISLVEPIIIKKIDDVLSITYNCYSDDTLKSNILIFSVVLYLNEHKTRPNQIDFKYISSTSRNDYFKNNFYIGYSNRLTRKYIQNSDKLNILNYGGSNITSSNIFPENQSEIINITNKIPNTLLPNCKNTIERNINLGYNFIFGNQIFKSCNISSSGYIFFGDLDESIKNVTNPFSNSTWKIMSPFGGNLLTTSEGVKINLYYNIFDITFNCSNTINRTNTTNTSSNILIFGLKLYLNEHPNRPNEVDYYYVLPTNVNFMGDYYIGYSDGNIQKTIIDSDTMTISYGQSSIQSQNKFPTFTNIDNITNMVPNKSIHLISKFCKLEKNINIGGKLQIGDNFYDSCTLSTNGFIYFGMNKSKNIREPNEDTSDPFKIKDWIIFAPFCGKLKTTPAGIIVTKDISDHRCSIMFNCYSSPILNTLIIFEIVIYYCSHPDNPNIVTFNYKYQDNLSVITKQKCYVGFSNGITQYKLINYNDTTLTEINNANNTTYLNKFPQLGTIKFSIT